MTLKEAREKADTLKIMDKVLIVTDPPLSETSEALIILDNRITELEDCLKWYADVRNHEGVSNYKSKVWVDIGYKARQILEEKT